MLESLFTLLVIQLWQVTLVAGVVYLAVRLFARDRPHLAHALWALVLLKCVTPPVFSSHLSPFSWAQARSAPKVAMLESEQDKPASATTFPEFSTPFEQSNPDAEFVVQVQNEPSPVWGASSDTTLETVEQEVASPWALAGMADRSLASRDGCESCAIDDSFVCLSPVCSTIGAA